MKFAAPTVTLLFLACSVMVWGQDEPADQTFTIDTPVNLDFKKEEEPVAKKKKKIKKKVYYGIKTKKGFTRKGTGDRVTYELFYYLKKPEKPQFLCAIFIGMISPVTKSGRQRHSIPQKECCSMVHMKRDRAGLFGKRNFLQGHATWPLDEIQARQHTG